MPKKTDGGYRKLVNLTAASAVLLDENRGIIQSIKGGNGKRIADRRIVEEALIEHNRALNGVEHNLYRRSWVWLERFGILLEFDEDQSTFNVCVDRSRLVDILFSPEYENGLGDGDGVRLKLQLTES